MDNKLLRLPFAIMFFATVTVAYAEEVTVVQGTLGAEGPLYVGGKLYFVEWTPGTLSSWDGKSRKIVNTAPGCNHNGLALTKQKTFLIACSADPGFILETTLEGKELRRWDVDSRGNKFVGGLNDIMVTANGGAYATIFGPYAAQPTLVAGKILYRAPGSDVWIDVVDDLNYANGIAISPDQKTLYVSETVGNTIKKFTVRSDGTLVDRANFAILDLYSVDRSHSPWFGPDSMKIDSKGNIYVAQWWGGKVLKLAPSGKLLHIFPIAAGVGTTNVAFGETEKELYVTVVRDPNDPKAPGSIVKIRNVQ